MRDKRGWMRILEATIAVMIVTGVMLTIYGGSSAEESAIESYAESVQDEILSSLVLDDGLRLAVLKVVNDDSTDDNFVIVDDYVSSQVAKDYGYLLRVCILGSDYDFCKMDSDTYIATVDRDVYVEEVVVSAEVGDGNGEEMYNPKKVRVYFWEGDVDLDGCVAECNEGDSGLGCSSDNRYVVQESCVEVDGCWVWEGSDSIEECEDDKVCEDGLCIDNDDGYMVLTCEKKEITETGCVSNYDDECDEWDGGRDTGSCGIFGSKGEYECWNLAEWSSECVEDSVCPDGYYEVSRAGCLM